MESKPFKFKILQSLEKRCHNYLYKTYNELPHDYNSLIISSIIYNGNLKIVSMFKEFLLYFDNMEFLERYYHSKNESKYKIKNICSLLKNKKYIPNYAPLPESIYLIHNLYQKAKLLNSIENEKLKKLKNNTQSSTFIFSNSMIYSIENESVYDSIINIKNKSILNLVKSIEENTIDENSNDYSISFKKISNKICDDYIKKFYSNSKNYNTNSIELPMIDKLIKRNLEKIKNKITLKTENFNFNSNKKRVNRKQNHINDEIFGLSQNIKLNLKKKMKKSININLLNICSNDSEIPHKKFDYKIINSLNYISTKEIKPNPTKNIKSKKCSKPKTKANQEITNKKELKTRYIKKISAKVGLLYTQKNLKVKNKYSNNKLRSISKTMKNTLTNMNFNNTCLNSINGKAFAEVNKNETTFKSSRKPDEKHYKFKTPTFFYFSKYELLKKNKIKQLKTKNIYSKHNFSSVDSKNYILSNRNMMKLVNNNPKKKKYFNNISLTKKYIHKKLSLSKLLNLKSISLNSPFKFGISQRKLIDNSKSQSKSQTKYKKINFPKNNTTNFMEKTVCNIQQGKHLSKNSNILMDNNIIGKLCKKIIQDKNFAITERKIKNNNKFHSNSFYQKLASMNKNNLLKKKIKNNVKINLKKKFFNDIKNNNYYKSSTISNSNENEISVNLHNHFTISNNIYHNNNSKVKKIKKYANSQSIRDKKSSSLLLCSFSPKNKYLNNIDIIDLFKNAKKKKENKKNQNDINTNKEKKIKKNSNICI